MKAILAALAIITAGPVHALSCMPHSIEATYQRAASDEAPYVIVHGRLTFDAALLPEVEMTRQEDTPPMTIIAGRLDGLSMTAEGFVVPYERNITLEVACYGPWCAAPQTGQDVLAFVRQDADQQVIATNPCGGDLFNAPRSDMLDTVRACHAGAACTPEKR